MARLPGRLVLPVACVASLVTRATCWSPPMACNHPARHVSVSMRYDSGGSGGYQRDPADRAPVDVARVEALLEQRSELRRDRRYDEADAVRAELQRQGVQIWDRDRMWSMNEEPPLRQEKYARADGRRRENNFYRSAQRAGARYEGQDDVAGYNEPRRAPRERVLNEWGHDYSRAADDASTHVDGAAILAINSLLKARLSAKLDKDYAKADELLEQLQQQHRVSVSDGAKSWRADGASFARKYKRVSPFGGNVDEASVEALLAERQAARKERNYARADELLAELLEAHGVVVVDSAFTWRHVGTAHDGAYGEGSGYGRRRDPAQDSARLPRGHDYVRDAGDDAPLDDEALAAIDDLLARRLVHKKRRDFDAADALQEELASERGVGVDDRSRTWWTFA